MALDDLFQPLTVRSLTVPNRFAMAPMTRQASPEGIPGSDVAAYYRRRAAGGVGLIITEGIRLPDPAAGFPASVPTIAGDEVLIAVAEKLSAFCAARSPLDHEAWLARHGGGRPGAWPTRWRAARAGDLDVLDINIVSRVFCCSS